MTATWACSSWLLLGSMAWAQTPSSPPAPTPTPTPTPAPEWAISSAPARLVVEQDQLDKHAPVSWVSFCLPDPNWLTLPIRVFADTGAAAGCGLLWTAPGERTMLLFDSSSGAKRYKIYFGSNWPALRLDNPKSGVILESRAGDGKPINDLNAMLQAWNQSSTIYGRGIVEGVFEGGHRFGPQCNIF